MSLLDEGHILQFADIVHRGGELYRDATLLPLPGAFYLLALAFDVFGPSIAVARWIVVVEFALFAAVVFALVRRLASGRAAWASVLALLLYKVWVFPHWQMYSYSTNAQLLLAGAVLGVVSFHASQRLATLAGAGLLVGLAIFTKQDYGAAGLLALNGALVLSLATAPARAGARGTLRVLAAFDGPVLAVGVLTALHFLREGLFGEMLRQTLVNHLIGISTGEYTGLPPILPLLERTELFRTVYGIGAYVPSILFTVDWPAVTRSALYRETPLFDDAIKLYFYAPYALAAGAALWIVRRRRDLRGPDRARALGRATLALYAIAAIAALNRPVDYVHVAVLYWPFLLLLVLWCRDALSTPRARRIALAAGALPLALLTAVTLRLDWRLHAQFDTPLRGERAGVRVMREEERVVGSAVDYLRENTRPGERAAVLPYFPLISFLAARDAPDPETYTLWPLEYDPTRQDRVIHALETRSADVLVYHFTQFAQLPPLREFAPKLFRYLVDHWEIDRVFSDPGWGYMMAGVRRSPAPPAGRPLLGEEASVPVRVAVERADGRPRALPDPAAPPAWGLALWPFRRVVELRPAPAPDRRVLAIPIDVPAAGARVETAVGVAPELWFRLPPSWVDLAVRARVPGEAPRTLFRRRLDPHRRAADRGWFPATLDLDPFAGRRIDLELVARCENATGETRAMGGFEVPRLVPR